jgi:ribosomal protein L7/L12
MIYEVKATKNIIHIGDSTLTTVVSNEVFNDIKAVAKIVRRIAFQQNPYLDKTRINPEYVGKIEIIKYVREKYSYSLREANDIVSAAQEFNDAALKGLMKEMNG